jgi:hypothetical protein
LIAPWAQNHHQNVQSAAACGFSPRRRNIQVTPHCFVIKNSACAVFLSPTRHAFSTSPKIVGNDSTRSFNFALQQLFDERGVANLSRDLGSELIPLV